MAANRFACCFLFLARHTCEFGQCILFHEVFAGALSQLCCGLIVDVASHALLFDVPHHAFSDVLHVEAHLDETLSITFQGFTHVCQFLATIKYRTAKQSKIFGVCCDDVDEIAQLVHRQAKFLGIFKQTGHAV